MGTVPKIGQGRTLSSTAEELTHVPQSELLGRLSPEAPKQITEEPPPPWEVDPRYRLHDTEARRFVDVPANWVLRWLSESMIRQYGMRNWEAVASSDPRVKVLNTSTVAPDNTVRKGDHRHGDILCWMWRSWWESRLGLKAEKVRKITQAARDRQQTTAEEVNRGTSGRYVTVDSAKHPTHTIGDGRSMTD